MKIFLFLFAQTANDPVDVGAVVGLVAAHALALTPIVKVVIDGVVKGLLNTSSKWLPAVAMGLGAVMNLAILAIAGSVFNVRSVVLAVIAGALAGIGAKVVNDVHEATALQQ